jgi:hypothetical protein
MKRGDRPSAANLRLTPKRQIEVGEYASACRRMVGALGRRIANGDVEGLAELVSVADHLDLVLRDAVMGLHEGRGLRDGHSYSWTEIARVLGVTRQAAHKRFGVEP